MLVWDTLPIQITVAGSEVVQDAVAYQSGKTRTLRFIAGPQTTNLWFRAYRGTMRVVSFDTKLLNANQAVLPVDVPINEGDTIKVGFIDKGVGVGTYNFAFCYEEK